MRTVSIFDTLAGIFSSPTIESQIIKIIEFRCLHLHEILMRGFWPVSHLEGFNKNGKIYGNIIYLVTKSK